MSNAVSPVFRRFQTELDSRHDKHERLVKLSRDITVASKRIIFSVHRASRYVLHSSCLMHWWPLILSICLSQSWEWKCVAGWKQEAQLMLTNPRDAFRGQSRSPNIVPFHMIGIDSSCTIVTLSFPIFDFKNAVTLKTGLWVRQGHWKYHHSIECIRLPIDVLW